VSREPKTAFQVAPWDHQGSTVLLRFSHGDHTFVEQLDFDVPFVLTPQRQSLLDMLSLVAAVSYAKAFAPINIDGTHFSLTTAIAEMCACVYDHGMREFAVHNNLALEPTLTLVHTAPQATHLEPVLSESCTPLIPMGGGRDSSVVATALQTLQPVLLSIGNNPYVENIAQRLSLPLHSVTRQIDQRLLALNAQGALNGHVPVTAINSLISLLAADIYGCNCVVMANEKSSSEPTRVIGDYEINHQYSKSYHFELVMRRALSSTGIGINYFSALRHRTDDEIAQAFSQFCAPLHTTFMSCNKAMLRDSSRRSNRWCGNCPKCRSVFLSLAPYMSPQHLVEIFGNDLLNDASQISGFKDLVDIEAKPFECVGEVASARRALSLVRSLPAWSQHVVVSSIGDVSPDSEIYPVALQEHFIPDPIHDLMNQVFSQ